jgi:hypothetical protein
MPIAARAPVGMQPPAANVTGGWAVQVGAFASPSQARAAAETARSNAPELLAGTRPETPATSPFGNSVLYRARLSGLSASAATAACGRISARGLACMTVPPGGA